ncbi:stage III sporulation protein AF [Clostridium sp. 19966]|nr:stage III sporulation protein AF [Clostridium sp. 19966]
MESMRGWIINICTAVFFITAVEMIMPNNNFKKYSKFVLGLILIVVIMNPLIKMLGNNNMDTYINQGINSLYSTSNNLTEDNNSTQSTVDTFEENLKKVCEDKLKQKYPKESFGVEVKAKYDKDKKIYNIANIDITENSDAVKPIEKIEIGKSEQEGSDKKETEHASEIKSFLGSELGISQNIINVS